jgi:hypothetical protein
MHYAHLSLFKTVVCNACKQIVFDTTCFRSPPFATIPKLFPQPSIRNDSRILPHFLFWGLGLGVPQRSKRRLGNGIMSATYRGEWKMPATGQVPGSDPALRLPCIETR